jgi:hypothetical protein
MRYVVGHVVAATGYARELIGFDGGQRRGVCVVHHTFFKGPSPQVAVEAFTIVIRFIELDVFRSGRFAEVVDIDMF